MKKLTVVFLSLFSISAFANFTNVKPGLWQVEPKMLINGKEVNLGGLLDSAMEKMPEDMKAKAKQATGARINEKGVLVCLSADAIKDPKSFVNSAKESSDCKVKITTQTATKIVGTAECPSQKGSSAFEFNYVSNTEYKGKIDVFIDSNKAMSTTYVAKFVKADCGEVKPH